MKNLNSLVVVVAAVAALSGCAVEELDAGPRLNEIEPIESKADQPGASSQPIAAARGSVSGNSGWAILPISRSSLTLQINPTTAVTRILDEGAWDQCVVELPSVRMGKYAALRTEPISNLRDGDCVEVRDALISSAAGGKLPAVLTIETEERVTWGVISDGTPYAQPYCDRELHQFAYLTGAAFGTGDYQTTTSVTLSALTHDECATFYGAKFGGG